MYLDTQCFVLGLEKFKGVISTNRGVYVLQELLLKNEKEVYLFVRNYWWGITDSF